jgi:hypothetical protein
MFCETSMSVMAAQFTLAPSRTSALKGLCAQLYKMRLSLADESTLHLAAGPADPAARLATIGGIKNG